MNAMKIRAATIDDIKWVNSRYREVKFKESCFENEIIAIAEIDSVKVGLGRLQNIDTHYAELGGIYVLPDFRGKNIARSIVNFLINNSIKYSKVYCLPFSHLKEFYKSMGFIDDDKNNVPDSVTKKHIWCNEAYENETLLFSKTNDLQVNM